MALIPPKQRPAYENCLLLARDGSPLATLSSRRALWYVKRGLGVRVTDYHDQRFNPVVRLTFKHRGTEPPRAEDLEYVENRCVVCGSPDSLTTHHVTPMRVKRFFPTRHKDHSRRLCVLVCDAHHAAAEVESHRIPNPPRWACSWLFPIWTWFNGGIRGINARYIAAFLRLKPCFVPAGWLTP